jgi:zinc protease
MRRLTAVLTLALACAACGSTPPKVEFKYAEKRAALQNGVKVIVIPDPNTPLVEVDARYAVGANEDPPGKAGLAHLVEHMMFQHRFLGPDKPATFEILPHVATFFNAYTAWEKTHYQLQGRKEDLQGLIRIEAGRLAAGCKMIPEAEFEREREVVRNEIRQRVDTPEKRAYMLLFEEAYPRGHAYHQTPGGDDEQLSSITFADVCSFIEKYYTPDRLTLIVAGDVEHEEVGRLVAENFAGIPARAGAPRTEVPPLPDFEHQVVEHQLDTDRSQVHVMWRMPAVGSEDWPAARALVGAMTARVAAFADDWDFAASVSGSLLGGGANGPANAPTYVLSMELHDAGNVGEALDYVWKSTKGAHRAYEGGIFDKETKNLIKADLLTGLEPLGLRTDFVADQVQFDRRGKLEFTGEGEYLFQALREIDELSGERFRSFIKGRLSKGNARVVVIKSSKKGIRGESRSALRFTATDHRKPTTPLVDPAEALRPIKAPASASVLENAERFTLGNGMKVVLLPLDGGMPVITARLVFAAGAAHEPPDKAGLAVLTASLLRPPPGSNFTRTGVSFSGFADYDTTTFVSRGMNIYLEVILKGLERVVKVGDIRQLSVEAWQKRMNVALDTRSARQSRAFNTAEAAALFGAEHPYTVTGVATPESRGRMGRDLLMDFKNKHYSAANATLVVVGAFDAAKAKEIIEDNFGSWGKGHRDQPPPAASRVAGPQMLGVVSEGAPQVALSIGYPGPAGIDGFHAARTILAEMLRQRMARARTELGSTYGLQVSWSPSVGPTAYGISGTVDVERAGETLKFLREQIAALHRGEGLQADFALARRVVLKRLLAESAETPSLAARLGQIAIYELAPDYVDKQIKMVAAAPLAQVKLLIKDELAAAKEVVVAMSDRATLEKVFAEAGLTAVKYVEVGSK